MHGYQSCFHFFWSFVAHLLVAEKSSFDWCSTFSFFHQVSLLDWESEFPQAQITFMVSRHQTLLQSRMHLCNAICCWHCSSRITYCFMFLFWSKRWMCVESQCQAHLQGNIGRASPWAINTSPDGCGASIWFVVLDPSCRHIMILDQILYAKPIGRQQWIQRISAPQLEGDTEGYLNLMLKFMCQGPLPDIEMVLRVSWHGTAESTITKQSTLVFRTHPSMFCNTCGSCRPALCKGTDRHMLKRFKSKMLHSHIRCFPLLGQSTLNL